MYHFERQTRILRYYFSYIFIVSSLLLLSDDQSYLPVIKRVDSQLDAVSAVLSVVPVTSILTTAGLVGVNMAAMSRLLEILGYDQSYLASGGAGTAAQPIGLQHNYAYNFPYVPGVNISVKGEHDFAAGGLATGSSTPYSVERKTYPSIMLPGEYERRHKYRNVDIRKLLLKAGIVPLEPLNQNYPSIKNFQHRQQVTNNDIQAQKNKEFESESTLFKSARSQQSVSGSQHPTSINSAASAAVSQSGPQVGLSEDDQLRFGMPTANIVHNLFGAT